MLATRTLLSKQTLAVISRQPACFVHQGDYGNWGNTNVAVVSERSRSISVGIIVLCESCLVGESRCIPGFLRMWLVGWDWCPRGSVVSIWPRTGMLHLTCHGAEMVNSQLSSSAPCTTSAATGLASRCLLQISSRCMWLTTWKSSRPLVRTGKLVRRHCQTDQGHRRVQWPN